jgi:hypothetical protein
VLVVALAVILDVRIVDALAVVVAAAAAVELVSWEYDFIVFMYVLTGMCRTSAAARAIASNRSAAAARKLVQSGGP